MKYMGSKARVAKEISPIINNLIQTNGITVYIEPFVGGSNMIEHIQCKQKIGCDLNEYLIEFWQQIQAGWNPQEVDITRELYYDIKANKDQYPKHIVALAGFCASYNAVWFGSYAGIVHTKVGTYRNYYDEAVRNVLKQAEKISDVQYKCLDYQQIDVEGALIYCDPPYQGTSKYKDDIDHAAYWDWVRKMSEKNIVLCSEYSAPPDFECIWQKQLTTTLDKNSRSKAVEKLFMFKKKGESKEMELKMNEYQLPEKISFNYEELKQELMNKVEMYTNLVYTDEQIGDAKKDKANLNKLKKALNDERIRLQKEYVEPFNVFKGQIDEIISIIDKPVLLIDKQVKEYEEKQKADKKAEIEELFGTIGFQDFVTLQMVWDEKWLNATTTMKKIEEAMKSEMCRIGNDIFTLQSLPEFGFEATEIYKKTLDLNKAIAEAQKMAEIAKQNAAHEAEMKARAEEQARLAAEAEAKKQEETVPENPAESLDNPPVPDAVAIEGGYDAPAKQWISFSALLSTEDALALKDFFNSRNIEFKAV